MSNSSFIILNGEPEKSADAKIPAINRGLMYGDGCFETLKSYDGKFLRWHSHFERLTSSLKYLKIDAPFSSEELKAQVYTLLQNNGLSGQEATVRIQCWRSGGRGYKSISNTANWMIQATEARSDKNSLNLTVAETRCIPSVSLQRKYKLSNGLNYIKAAQEAHANHCDDALMLTVEDKVSETTSANIFWIANGMVYTPSERCDLLPGVTRALTIEATQNLNIEVKEGEFALADVKSAKAVFCTNSLIELREVKALDGTGFQTGHPLFEQIRQEFERLKVQELKV